MSKISLCTLRVGIARVIATADSLLEPFAVSFRFFFRFFFLLWFRWLGHFWNIGIDQFCVSVCEWVRDFVCECTGGWLYAWVYLYECDSVRMYERLVVTPAMKYRRPAKSSTSLQRFFCFSFDTCAWCMKKFCDKKMLCDWRMYEVWHSGICTLTSVRMCMDDNKIRTAISMSESSARSYVPMGFSRAGVKRTPVSSKTSLQAINNTPRKITTVPVCVPVCFRPATISGHGNLFNKMRANMPAALKAFSSPRYLSSSRSTRPPGICIWTIHTHTHTREQGLRVWYKFVSRADEYDGCTAQNCEGCFEVDCLLVPTRNYMNCMSIIPPFLFLKAESNNNPCDRCTRNTNALFSSVGLLFLGIVSPNAFIIEG